MNAGQHVLYETLMAGDIDETDLNLAEIQIGKAEVNGDAAFLLFGESVGILCR